RAGEATPAALAEVAGRAGVHAAVRAGHRRDLSRGDLLQHGIEERLGLDRVVQAVTRNLLQDGVPGTAVLRPLQGGVVRGPLLRRFRRLAAAVVPDPAVVRPAPTAERGVRQQGLGDPRDVLFKLLAGAAVGA